MPQQSSKASTYVFIPDGCKVEIKQYGAGSYTDLGHVNGDVNIPVEWTDVKIQANDATVIKNYKKDMKMTGSFELMDLDPAGIELLGGGLITSVATPASANSAIPNQIVPVSWANNTIYDLLMLTSSSDSTPLKMGSTKPTITSVTLDAAGTPEVLTEFGSGSGIEAYQIVKTNSVSGWGIIFEDANMTTLTPTTKAITIDYGTNTPVARTTLYCGSSTAVFNAYALKLSHTDSAALSRGIEIFSVSTNSGGFAFSFKSALSDGTDVLPVNFTAEIDTTKTDGRQLFGAWVDTGTV